MKGFSASLDMRRCKDSDHKGLQLLFQGITIACFWSCTYVPCKVIPIIQCIVLIIFVLIIKQEYLFIGSPLFLYNYTNITL